MQNKRYSNSKFNDAVLHENIIKRLLQGGERGGARAHLRISPEDMKYINSVLHIFSYFGNKIILK